MSNKLLTVAICSNRLDNLNDYTLPLLRELKDFCVTQIYLDGSIKDNLSSFYNKIGKSGEPEIFLEKKISGHSNLRNFVLKSCKTKYLLFLDDDITTTIEAIKAIITELENDRHIVGLPLTLPKNINFNKWFLSQNQYHYLAIHTKSTLDSVWGACMAFNIEPIRRLKLTFDNKLGRQNNKFLSGEDTTFIAFLRQNGCRTKVLGSFFAIHCVDASRLFFSNLFKRVFWQGITEAIRQNIKDGFIKEMNRNFAVLNPLNFVLGLFWMLVFSLGCFYGILYRKFHK